MIDSTDISAGPALSGGLRTRGAIRQNLPNKPLMIVITVIYNGAQFLELTIQSIINQTYQNIEYIIIDGGSTDGTLDIIRKYDEYIDYWISEPDKGIYDAMNKGIQAASDGYLWFINAGDEIYNPTTISSIFSSGISDIYYGKTALKNNNHEIINTLTAPKTLSWTDMYKGMIVSHQSIIINKKIAQPYDLQYRYVSDHDWIINALRKATYIRYVDIVFSKYLLEGFSHANFEGCWVDRFKILRKHYNGFSYYINFYFYYLQKLKKIIKSKVVK